MSSGSGPMSSSLSSVAARSGESCRFAGASSRPSGMPLSVDHERPFHAQLAAVDRSTARAFPAAGGLGDAPVDGDVLQDQAEDPVIKYSRAICLSSVKIPAMIYSSRRSRIVVAPQVQSAIDA